MRTACSTHFSLITGSMPGMPASMKETWLLGSAPNSVEAPENSLDLDRTWAWTSMPITTSQSPVWPLMQLVEVAGAFMPLSTSWPGLWLKSAAVFDRQAGAQHGAFVEGLADQLQAQRQAVLGQTGGHRKPRQARQVHRHGENVVQIHGDRIGGLLAHAEGRARGGGGQQHVAAFEGLVEIALDQGAQLLGAGVIGVVIARRQNIGADQDAALHFGAEAFGRGSSHKAR